MSEEVKNTEEVIVLDASHNKIIMDEFEVEKDDSATLSLLVEDKYPGCQWMQMTDDTKTEDLRKGYW